jgi:SAM-dependent methyltransferase
MERRYPLDIVHWIEQNLPITSCTSDVFIYDDMESQSGQSLPVIYKPFDANQASHWQDRGQILDYLCATDGREKRLLDFGPGDGWPSLGIAPFTKEVIGVDASMKRVEVCRANAARLGTTNAYFVHIPAGEALPFDDESFDGVVAASSIEQTPDPKATLREIYRVLRPQGRLRIWYEALNRYGGGREREIWLSAIGHCTCRLIIYVRDIAGERTEQYGLTFRMSREELAASLAPGKSEPTYGDLSIKTLDNLRLQIVDVRKCALRHPSAKTLATWLEEVGFSEVLPTHDGGTFARRLYDHVPIDRRPSDIDGLDAVLEPLVGIAVELAAPIGLDPMITAVK